jgi:hypothetical protein
MSTDAAAANQPARPPWLDEELYPFESHYADVAGARVHYVDEGSGPPLLLLPSHGHARRRRPLHTGGRRRGDHRGDPQLERGAARLMAPHPAMESPGRAASQHEANINKGGQHEHHRRER